MNVIHYILDMEGCRCDGKLGKFRPLIKTPPRSNRNFPERSSEWPNTYPALIKPWLGGVRAYWIDSIQAFQLEEGSILRVDGIEPYIPDGIMDKPAQNILGEFYEKGVSYEETLSRVVENRPTPDLDFCIFDAELDLPARDRAEYCLQIPRQWDNHVRTVEMYEVISKGGFRTHLDVWRKSLFEGALAVGAADPWMATEYEVRVLLP